jgi:hypothetical protein
MRERVNTKFLRALGLACLGSAACWIVFLYSFVLFGGLAVFMALGIIGLTSIFLLVFTR